MTSANNDIKKEDFDAAAILEEALEAVGLDPHGPSLDKEKFTMEPEFLDIIKIIGSNYSEAFKELA